MTESIIQELIDQEEDTQKGRFLTFTLGSECYGMEIQYVSEIIGIQPITEMPEHPEYVRGIINLRGKIIPVMDVRIRFKKQSIEYNDRTCIIVIIIDDVSIGLIVDSVAEVLTIPDHDIVSPPDISGVSNKYIQGIGKVGNEVKMLLNCDKLLNEQDVEYLATI